MPRAKALRATLVAIIANAMLLVLKGLASGFSDSLTIFSETLNSLSDVVSAVVILLCVRWAWQRPDEGHPFGHRRAEPLAGLLVAIFAGILGFEVVRTAVLDLLRGNSAESIGLFPVIALCITAVTKSLLAVYFRRQGKRLDSPALRATAIDCRNDVLISAQGLIGVLVAEYRLPLLDTCAALVVGLYILYSAHRIGMENIDFLMGRAPGRELLDSIRSSAAGVPRVLGIADVRAHYVGTLVHVELTVIVDGSLTTLESHDISEAVRSAVEGLAGVNRAFVHIQPLEAAQEGVGQTAG